MKENLLVMPKSKLLSKYTFYRDIMEKLLLPIGVRTKNKPNFVIRSLPFIQTTISFIMSIAIFRYVQIHFNNMALVTRSISIMITFFTTTMKMTCLIIYKKEIAELHATLDPYFNELMKKSDITNYILQPLPKFSRLTWTFLFFLCFCGLAWNILPLHSIVTQYLRHSQPAHYNLIFPAVYPWTVPTNGLLFKLHFLFESSASITLVTVTASINSLFPFYIFLMVGQLREFCHNVADINEKSDSEMIIKKCVIQYCTIIKCRDKLQKVFGPIILWIMVTNGVILCTVIFQISNMKSISKGRAILFASYTSLKFTEAFLFSFAGTCLTVESENWRDAVYDSNWYENKRSMTSVVIMLSQKPIVITACNFAVVSLDIFVAIVNTTISYFFLLRTLEQA